MLYRRSLLAIHFKYSRESTLSLLKERFNSYYQRKDNFLNYHIPFLYILCVQCGCIFGDFCMELHTVKSEERLNLFMTKKKKSWQTEMLDSYCWPSLFLHLYSFLKQSLLTLRFYFFIFGCAGSLLLFGLALAAASEDSSQVVGAWTSPCGGFSHCRAQAPGCSGFGSCSSRAPEHRLRSHAAQA